MPYELMHNIQAVYARDYLQLDKGRGRALELKHLGLSFYTLRDCLCAGQDSQVIAPVPDSGGILCVFLDSVPYPSNEPQLFGILAKNLTRPEVEIEEAAPFFPPGAENLWHWTCESLPRLLALESTGYSGAYIVPAAAWSDENSVIMQSLGMLGIDHARLLPSGPLYRVRRMFLPQRLSGFELAEMLPLAEFLREKLLKACGSLEGSKRLYVQRIGRRKVLNEDKAMSVLDDFGFEVMTPESLSLKEQWRAMTNVECSVMAHGANSSLSLLQRPGSGMIELFGNRYTSYNNLHAARLLRLDYYPLVEELELANFPAEKSSVPEFLLQGMAVDITVDILHLRIILERMLGKA